ncbi:GrpB family protein [Staphylococcus xylosus]|uniref:GrpB family protein n=1 Tax=Staphylococcus xylosus TaxID=1288 RepID=UPI0030C68521
MYEILGQEIIKCEHFGSTSVEGMKAKPVIDMLIIVRDINLIDTYNDTFKKRIMM